MPVTPKMDSFQREVRCNQRVLVLFLATASHHSQHGAVVSNSSRNKGIFCRLRHAANLCDERFFGNYHANTISDARQQMQNTDAEHGCGIWIAGLKNAA